METVNINSDVIIGWMFCESVESGNFKNVCGLTNSNYIIFKLGEREGVRGVVLMNGRTDSGKRKIFSMRIENLSKT